MLTVPAKARVFHLAKNELVRIDIELPSMHEVEGIPYPIYDYMTPGAAFIATPFGSRTKRWEKRAYTRSNCAELTPMRLETIVNYSKSKEKPANTSAWWQEDDLAETTLEVRVEFDETHTHLKPFSLAHKEEAQSLLLEPIEMLCVMKRICAIGFYTGATPFLAYTRYMAAYHFGHALLTGQDDFRFIFIVCVQKESHLMYHNELEKIQKKFPYNFTYWPVLTRTWSKDWRYGRGRLLDPDREHIRSRVDIIPLLATVRGIENLHLRVCGGCEPRDRILLGLEQYGIKPLSFRSECW